MNSKLFWKELTEDGLLKEPEPLGPHYSTESLNKYGGFETEEEAIIHLKLMKETYSMGTSGNYVLVRIY